jgi:hypothetical protein
MANDTFRKKSSRLPSEGGKEHLKGESRISGKEFAVELNLIRGMR